MHTYMIMYDIGVHRYIATYDARTYYDVKQTIDTYKYVGSILAWIEGLGSDSNEGKGAEGKREDEYLKIFLYILLCLYVD